MPVQTAIQLRRGTAASWTSTNPTLAAGEVGVETDTRKIKIGDGTTAWASLKYANIPQTTVTTKGDLLAASAADTVTRLAAGNNGETLVADSASSTGLRYTAGVGLTQPVINGAFDVWQRGTSFAAASNNTFTADRWAGGGNGNALTISRQSTNDTTNLPTIQYCARVQRDSGNTNTFARVILQNVETANTYPFIGKTITLSFWARKGADYSSASDALDVRLTTGTGTDQNSFSSYTGASNIISSNVTLTTTWQRFSLTGTVGSTALEMSPSFRYTPVGTAGAADYFEITGVQIDVGNVALPFRRSGGTLQGELALAQRYYESLSNNGAANGEYIASGFARSTSESRSVFYYATQKRVAATVTLPTAGDLSVDYLTTGTAANSVAALRPSQRTAVIGHTITAAPLTAGQGVILRWTNSATSLIEVSAEL